MFAYLAAPAASAAGIIHNKSISCSARQLLCRLTEQIEAYRLQTDDDIGPIAAHGATDRLRNTVLSCGCGLAFTERGERALDRALACTETALTVE